MSRTARTDRSQLSLAFCAGAPRLYHYPGPNPDLSDFARRHAFERAYDPRNDTYRVGPFTETIHTTKQSAIYALHGYHLGKKPHDAIRAYIRHFTEPGDMVLDPFSGSGSTALASLLERRKAVAIDASPAASFIARYYVAPIEPKDFSRRFDAMVERVRDEIEMLYGTTCHRCGGPATLHYVVYSNTYACPSCGAVVSLFQAAHDTSPPRCPRCPNRNDAAVISSKLRVVGTMPVAVSFSCKGSCRPRRFDRSICGTPEQVCAFEQLDLVAIEALQRKPIPHPVPDAHMMHVEDHDAPWGDEWRPSRNFRRIREIFTHRNLWALCALKEAAGDDLDLQALITSGMLAVSRKAQHLDRGGGYIPGNWALPPMTKQRNVLESLTKVFRRSLAAREVLSAAGMGREVCLSTQSATDLSAIPDDSVDYIFTDPPYGGAVQYAELNFLWETWLGLDTHWHPDEIVVNRTRRQSETMWTERMTKVFSECRRVLKPGRWMSVCYHDVSGGTWSALQQAVREAGLVNESAVEAVAIDTGGRTYNQYTVDKATKRDLVLNFRKPRSGMQTQLALIEADGDFEARASETIRAFVRENPGATKDRIYDDLVARTLRAGTMRSHDFERLLRTVAVERSEGRAVSAGTRKGMRTARWYLREET